MGRAIATLRARSETHHEIISSRVILRFFRVDKILHSLLPKKGNAVYFEYANDLRQVDAKMSACMCCIFAGGKWA